MDQIFEKGLALLVYDAFHNLFLDNKSKTTNDAEKISYFTDPRKPISGKVNFRLVQLRPEDKISSKSNHASEKQQ